MPLVPFQSFCCLFWNVLNYGALNKVLGSKVNSTVMQITYESAMSCARNG